MKFPPHANPQADFALHQVLAAGVTISGREQQQISQIREVAYRHHNHRVIGLPFQHVAINEQGIGDFGVGPKAVGEILAQTLREPGGELHSVPPGHAYRERGPPIIRVDGIDTRRRPAIRRTDHCREDLAFPQVRQRMEDSHGSRIVAIGHHVRVKEDLDRLGRLNRQYRPERHCRGETP